MILFQQCAICLFGFLFILFHSFASLYFHRFAFSSILHFAPFSMFNTFFIFYFFFCIWETEESRKIFFIYLWNEYPHQSWWWFAKKEWNDNNNDYAYSKIINEISNFCLTKLIPFVWTLILLFYYTIDIYID